MWMWTCFKFTYQKTKAMNLKCVSRCIKCVLHFLTVLNCAKICKVGDFGLARWQPDGDMGVDTRVIGTFGYVLYRS